MESNVGIVDVSAKNQRTNDETSDPRLFTREELRSSTANSEIHNPARIQFHRNRNPCLAIERPSNKQRPGVFSSNDAS